MDIEEYDSYTNEVKNFLKKSKEEYCHLLKNIGLTFAENDNTDSSSTCHDITYEKMKEILSNIREHIDRSLGSANQKSSNGLSSPVAKEFLPDESIVCQIDQETKKNLLQSTRSSESIPNAASTADEYLANYSTEEKNILYEYALKNTTRIQVPPELSFEEASMDVVSSTSHANLSEREQYIKMLEDLKKERDLKRRRTAYRRKVSTKNKSHTEVTRELISNMMEAMFGERFESDEGEERQCIKRDSSKGREKRDCSSEKKIKDNYHTQKNSDLRDERRRQRNYSEEQEGFSGEGHDSRRRDSSDIRGNRSVCSNNLKYINFDCDMRCKKSKGRYEDSKDIEFHHEKYSKAHSEDEHAICDYVSDLDKKLYSKRHKHKKSSKKKRDKRKD